MAVEWVRQKRERQWGRDQKSAKGVRVWLVKCTDINDGPDLAAAASGIPRVGNAWSITQGFLKVVSVDADEYESSGFIFQVTVTYGTDERDEGQLPETHPLDRAPQVSMRFEKFSETVFKAQDVPTGEQDGRPYTLTWKWNKTVCNSAGMNFDPSVENVFYDPVFTIVRNESKPDFGFLGDLVGAICDDEFAFIHRGRSYTVKKNNGFMIDIATSPQLEIFNELKVEYDQVTYEIGVRTDGWKRKVKDEGLFELMNGDGPPGTPIRDSNGDPVTRPSLLDGKGQRLTGSAVKPVFLVFDLNKKRNFTQLGLQLARGVR